MSESSSAIEAGSTYFKDTSKPDGDACREDGTLKDASELEWPNSPSDPAPNFPKDSVSDSDTRHEDFLPSYLSNGKKRKHDSSDEEDSDVSMDSLAHDKNTQKKRLAGGNKGSDEEIELTGRKNAAASGSSKTVQRQIRHKSDKRKRDNTDDSNADSGESEKEDVVMEEDRNKVSLFSYLCNACTLT